MNDLISDYHYLPVMVADDDFIEFLQEESVFDSIELVELAELFALWMKENCE
jgi:UDP-2,3-diacylglucosamine pyrophosphatase LpxH